MLFSHCKEEESNASVTVKERIKLSFTHLLDAHETAPIYGSNHQILGNSLWLQYVLLF